MGCFFHCLQPDMAETRSVPDVLLDVVRAAAGETVAASLRGPEANESQPRKNKTKELHRNHQKNNRRQDEEEEKDHDYHGTNSVDSLGGCGQHWMDPFLGFLGRRKGSFCLRLILMIFRLL